MKDNCFEQAHVMPSFYIFPALQCMSFRLLQHNLVGTTQCWKRL